VTDRQRDGQAARSYYSGQHCEQCGRTGKINGNYSLTRSNTCSDAQYRYAYIKRLVALESDDTVHLTDRCS